MKSHVIPEFLFRKIYDEKHRAFAEGLDNQYYKPIQKGWREPLLCETCEQHISKWERYFSEIWYEGQILQVNKDDGLTVENIDYAKFKLFHLSILWRASVSNMSECAKVELGPHQEVLRKMVLNGDPGKAEDYRILGIALLFPNTLEMFHEIIITPHFAKPDGLNSYFFVFAGCMWAYFISSHKTLSFFKAGLSENGTLLMPAADFSLFPELLSRYTKLEKKRKIASI